MINCKSINNSFKEETQHFMAYAIGNKVFVTYQHLLNTVIYLFIFLQSCSFYNSNNNNNKRLWKYVISKKL